MKLSKETIQLIKEHNKKFRKAEKEGRIIYDSDRCIIWIFDKEEQKWKTTIEYYNP